MKFLALIQCVALISSIHAGAMLRSAKELSDFRNDPDPHDQREFALTGVITTVMFGGYYLLTDTTGGTIIDIPSNHPPLVRGNYVYVAGKTISTKTNAHVPCSNTVTILGNKPASQPQAATIEDILTGRFDNTEVSVKGIATDVSIDNVDGRCYIVILYDQGKTISVAITFETPDIEWMRSISGAKLSLTGVVNPRIGGIRTFHRRGINALRDDVKILEPPDRAFKAGKDINSLRLSDYETVNELQERLSVTGIVEATWRQRHFLITTPDGWHSTISLAGPQPLPSVGKFVKAVGFPQSDSLTINLTSAVWKEEQSAILSGCDGEPIDVDINQIVTQKNETANFKVYYHGKRIRIRGTVLHLPEISRNGAYLHLSCDSYVLPVDISSLPSWYDFPPVGSQVEVSGICMVMIKSQKFSFSFPRIVGFELLTQKPSDIQIIDTPPFWTPFRLFVIVCSLILGLCLFLVWNLLLQRVTARRGRRLFQEQLAHAASELKAKERTRLAVELHDAMSQNISGAVLQINAAERLAETDRDKERHHLRIAAKTLQSCREELRDCIWDLRNQSFDEPDLDKAITRMLRILLDDVTFSVRFNVPRDRLSDNTVHLILKIIRELAVNAVRHGKAHFIKIAGALEDGEIRFSVTDDGCGFDPNNRPGITNGHFGLQGIMERVRLFQGRMEIKSAANAGTKVKIVLKVRANRQNGSKTI